MVLLLRLRLIERTPDVVAILTDYIGFVHVVITISLDDGMKEIIVSLDHLLFLFVLRVLVLAKSID